MDSYKILRKRRIIEFWDGSPEECGELRKTLLRMVRAALGLDAEPELRPACSPRVVTSPREQYIFS